MLCVRWNEMKLKELRDEESTTAHQQRAGRWVKWREMAQEEAEKNKLKINIPAQIEKLGDTFWICLDPFESF